MATSLASASIVFKDNKAYSQKLVHGARTLFKFARDQRGRYSVGTEASTFYNSTSFTSQSMSQSVSSSSLEMVVVPDHDSTTAYVANDSVSVPIPISVIDREARVLRYREKKESRKFEKTIRYASRKAYVETRPRIKGRFAKRSELEVDSFISYDDASFCVVPTF